jgi:hypothetical protein
MTDIWLLTYEVVPCPASPDFRRVGGAYVNCWIKASSQPDAAEICVRQLSETQWSIVELTEAKPVNPEAEQYSSASMRMIEQAQVEGAVFVFNKWPQMVAPNRRWLPVAAILASVVIGYGWGSVVHFVRLPADPTGELASPVAGGLIGLVLSLFLLAIHDASRK